MASGDALPHRLSPTPHQPSPDTAKPPLFIPSKNDNLFNIAKIDGLLEVLSSQAHVQAIFFELGNVFTNGLTSSHVLKLRLDHALPSGTRRLPLPCFSISSVEIKLAWENKWADVDLLRAQITVYMCSFSMLS